MNEIRPLIYDILKIIMVQFYHKIFLQYPPYSLANWWAPAQGGDSIFRKPVPKMKKLLAVFSPSKKSSEISLKYTGTAFLQVLLDK
jgi:hypothetical protein